MTSAEFDRINDFFLERYFEKEPGFDKKPPNPPQLGYTRKNILTKIIVMKPFHEQIEEYKTGFGERDFIKTPNFLISGDPARFKGDISSVFFNLEQLQAQDCIVNTLMRNLASHLNNLSPGTAHLYVIINEEGGTKEFRTIQ